MTTPEQREARDAYDAACRKRQQLIDEAETLCGELGHEIDWTIRHYGPTGGGIRRIQRALIRAEARLERREGADVEF